MGDINPTLFLSPAKPGAIIWGSGPMFTFRPRSIPSLAPASISVGPAAVALTMQGPWVFGALEGTIGTRPLAAYAQSLTPKV